MLGAKSIHAKQCREGGFIFAHFGIELDLSNELTEDFKSFTAKWRPYLVEKEGKSAVAAGLNCGALWTICKGISIGDTVLSPDGTGNYLVGEVTGDYYYVSDPELPHRRPIRWMPGTIKRSDMSQALQNSTGSIGTSSEITQYGDEIDALIGGKRPPTLVSNDNTIEDPVAFALEKHLEDFLVSNWSKTEFGKDYKIFEDDGELVGQQYPSDTGPIDILAISKDEKEILVVELKKGRASDNVVGQVQRYMGFVKEELCTREQTVKGVIVALEDDTRIRRALSVANNIDFYRYEVNFKLKKQ
jgi:restriction system protein